MKNILQGTFVIFMLFGGLLAEPLVDMLTVDHAKIEKKLFSILDKIAN